MHFNILLYILFTIFQSTCFGQYSGHLQGDVLITSLQLWVNVSQSLYNNSKYLSVSPSLHNNYKYF